MHYNSLVSYEASLKYEEEGVKTAGQDPFLLLLLSGLGVDGKL